MTAAGVTLTPEEAVLVVDVLREIPDMDIRMAQIRPSRQQEIDERRSLADKISKMINGENNG